MTRRNRRLMFIGAGLAGLALATTLVLTALSSNMMFFVSPSDALAAPPPPGQRLRLGGLVAEGTVIRDAGTVIRFDVTDGAARVPVTYEGILPDLFREGQGVIVQGTFSDGGVFAADEVLARHDETYMPPEVAEALKRSGQWKGEAGTRPPAEALAP